MEMKALREIVWDRSKGYCEKCGSWMRQDSWALHHRKLKSRGGKDTVSNCVALHHSCHNLATDSVHANPAAAEQLGFMVGSWQEPSECPVTLSSGDIVILTEDGTYKHLEKGKSNGW